MDKEDDKLSSNCTLCHYKFVHAKFVKTHARTHIRKKPSPCQLCEKSYENDGRLKHHKNCSHVIGIQLLPPLQLRPEFGEAADKVASGKELTEVMPSVLLEGIMYYIITLFTHYAKAAQEMMVFEYHNAMREFTQGILVLATLAKLFSTMLLTLLAQAHPSSTRYIKVFMNGYLDRNNNSYVRLGGKMCDNGPISMAAKSKAGWDFQGEGGKNLPAKF